MRWEGTTKGKGARRARTQSWCISFTDVEVRNFQKGFKKGWDSHPHTPSLIPRRMKTYEKYFEIWQIGVGKSMCMSQDTTSCCSGLVRGVYGI